MFVTSKGGISYFCSKKCEKNRFKLKRKARKLGWTKDYRKEKKTRLRALEHSTAEKEGEEAKKKEERKAEKETKKAETKTKKEVKKKAEKEAKKKKTEPKKKKTKKK